MKKILFIITGVVFLFCLYLCAYAVISGEVAFFNDIARDFLLLIELDQKKMVFIGPRSSTAGLFYGSLLTYLNYPAYLIGGGNPVAVAWFWILLIIIFAISSFFIVKKLFGELAATLFTLIVTVKLAPHANAIFEPVAIYFVMPTFLFTIIMYERTKKWIYLAFHFPALAVIIQWSPGIGAQFFFLTTFLVGFLIYRTKQWGDLLTFLVLPLGIANLILFDIKNQFSMAKALMGAGGATKLLITVPEWISNRVQNTFSLQLFEGGGLLVLAAGVFLIVMFCSISIVRSDKKMKPIYLIFMFYYFGYMILSYFNKGVLLLHYMYLLTPFTILWLVSFLNGKYRNIFLPIVLLVFFISLQYALFYTNSLKSYSAKDPNSWKGLLATANKVSELQKGKPFGYYVFAPDAYAYQPRYAMIYGFKNSNAQEYTKMATTYVIAQPPPVEDKYMDYKWWVKVPVGITKKPSQVITMPNGYKILKFELTDEEQKIPHDKSIELGIHFR